MHQVMRRTYQVLDTRRYCQATVGTCQVPEVLEEGGAICGGAALGMELHPVMGAAPVCQGHQHPACRSLCCTAPGAGRCRLRWNVEGVVTGARPCDGL